LLKAVGDEVLIVEPPFGSLFKTPDLTVGARRPKSSSDLREAKFLQDLDGEFTADGGKTFQEVVGARRFPSSRTTS